MPAIVAVESFIIGSALDALAPDDDLRPSDDTPPAPTLEAAERAVRRHAAEQGRSPATAAFEFGLRALVAGLRAAARDEAE